MEQWQEKLNGDPLPWLLENDETQPAVRFFIPFGERLQAGDDLSNNRLNRVRPG